VRVQGDGSLITALYGLEMNPEAYAGERYRIDDGLREGWGRGGVSR
jgi:hypothetical protein